MRDLISVIGFIEVRRKLDSLTVKSDKCKLDCLCVEFFFGRSLFLLLPNEIGFQFQELFDFECAFNQKQHMANGTIRNRKTEHKMSFVLKEKVQKKTIFFAFIFLLRVVRTLCDIEFRFIESVHR